MEHHPDYSLGLAHLPLLHNDFFVTREFSM